MSNPAKSAQDIDWDKIAKRLGRAFDAAMDQAEGSGYYEDQDSCAALNAASNVARALAKVSERAEAAKAAAEAAKEKDGFKISKPGS